MTKNVNKTAENKKLIARKKIEIELIKDTTKRETEELRIERINKLKTIIEMKTVIEEQRIERKFNEFANNSNIKFKNIITLN